MDGIVLLEKLLAFIRFIGGSSVLLAGSDTLPYWFWRVKQ
jgi:hypothetical protein